MATSRRCKRCQSWLSADSLARDAVCVACEVEVAERKADALATDGETRMAHVTERSVYGTHTTDRVDG